MDHIPILRAGEPYTSLDRVQVSHIQSGEPLVEVSQANRGLIGRDLSRVGASKSALEEFSVAELMGMCKAAARLFMEEDLPLGEASQSPEAYVEHLSGTTGMPQALCRKNMEKIRKVLDEVELVLDGLTRGLDLGVLDQGWNEQGGRPLNYVAQTQALGAVLPSNSPGVHALWVPAIPLKVPLALKPGREEPWTPFRIAQAFMAAGCPPAAFSFYPTDHGGGAEILLRCQRSLLFGGGATVEPWLAEPGVQIHGPGQSKIAFGADCAADWQDHLELITTSVAENGGRSCINASGVWTPAHGRDLAAALAERLAPMVGRPLDDPQAQIAAFSNKAMARHMAAFVEGQLKADGAVDLTAQIRGRGPLVERDGLTFLEPTVLWCEDPAHPLANTELLFPFVSVVQTPQEQMIEELGPSLVLTAITRDRPWIERLLAAGHIERLNLGPICTNHLSWDQPHEGNLFEHLYRQRAFQAQAV